MYTCPMHPEIRQEKSGRCTECGMSLVDEMKQNNKPVITDKGLGQITWRSYVPLLVIFSLLLISTFVISLADYSLGSFSVSNSVSHFMAGFFLVFAGFKLLDLKGFAEGYSTYDLLAQRVPVYGYLYPFIELSFGLGMLGGLQSPMLLWAEVIIMLFSGIGVAIKIAKKEKFQCACLGTFLKVPLTYVTLIEDFGMVALALLLLIYH